MKLAYILAAALVILTGCAGSPMRVSMMDTNELAAQTPETLCNAVGMGGAANARAELKRRNALTAQEWALVDDDSVQVGMSAMAARCSWGIPDRVNTTLTSAGRSEQWVWRPVCSGGICMGRRAYLYVTNGTVSAIQN